MLGDARDVGEANWKPERRRLRPAVHKSVEKGHTAVGHAEDLYRKAIKRKERRK
ncbi:MAG: hypothetical protein JW744_05865 [Candidatus Diapherotrites archaeon]|uniref:Uncharacterized protein n=1 Tax=Candidatus Iainarchaeum sp. TaxID=3101447 RepID=A0A939C9D7_9ARCH|nr:hypothetical protein [Candidatus Diapherotrites archaeon]